MTAPKAVYYGECEGCGHSIESPAPIDQNGKPFRCFECGNVTRLHNYRGKNATK